MRRILEILRQHTLGLRKVQIRPEKRDPAHIWIIVKYGGLLTAHGEREAAELGRFFQEHAYHENWTRYRPLEIRTVDDHAWATAAVFTKNLLQVRGSLQQTAASITSAGAGLPCARQRGDNGDIAEQRQPMMNIQPRHHQIKPSFITLGHGDVSCS